jgi:16S rRNA (guanine966-N2)-methyltransferase
MRVIAGDLGGRRLVAPRGWKVRPTSDRAREAIFSVLGTRVEGAAVLDLFCGTGALAIEALSRGAARATLVDRDTRAALGNIENLALADRVELVRADVSGWVGRAEAEGAPRFDLVFVDAPYKLAGRVGQELDIHLPRLLNKGGRAIVESGARRPLRIDSLPRLRQRRYGAADISIYGEDD